MNIYLVQNSAMINIENNEKYTGSFPVSSLSLDVEGDTLRVYSKGYSNYITDYLKPSQILKKDGTTYSNTIKGVQDALNAFL